jgi:mannose/fructose-specific phosphotransferase system component IIA
MSESAPLRAAVVGHGSMAAGLVEAVRMITGIEAGALVPISNRGKSPEALAAELQEAVGDGPAIIFTDLPAGSCCMVARRMCKACAGVAVVSSVNLPLLIEFAMNRERPLDELVEHLVTMGRAAITAVPAGQSAG